MNDLELRIVDSFPEPAFSALAEASFSDYLASDMLRDVLTDEAAGGASLQSVDDAGALRIVAFRNQSLVGWTFAKAEGTKRLQMINSGVAAGERRRGVYSTLVQCVIDHARAQGCIAISSRHAANNNAVIIAKLKLGFFVSGFEYSEIYGPLVRLTFLVGDARRRLHQLRASPIRPG